MNNPYYQDDIQELLNLTDGIILPNGKITDLAVSFLTSVTLAPKLTAMTMIAIWDTTVIEIMSDVPTALRLHYNQATNTLFPALIERLFPVSLGEIAALFASTRIAPGMVVNTTR